jgi:hypothetical protein
VHPENPRGTCRAGNIASAPTASRRNLNRGNEPIQRQ